MDQLVPCDRRACRLLAEKLGDQTKKSAEYMAKVFPNIVLDVTLDLAELSTESARKAQDPVEAVKQQLKPYFTFSLLLGKCPQVSSLMHNYFRSSSFQPLPDMLFTVDDKSTITYKHAGFTDALLIDILVSFIRYLSHNRSWFGAVWNWTELSRLVSSHPNPDIRYLAACSLSIIFQPTRYQHISFINQVCHNDHQTLINLQIKYQHVYENIFKLCVETKAGEIATSYANVVGYSDSGYSYCPKTMTKVTNVLLLKNTKSSDKHLKEQSEKLALDYITLDRLTETTSEVAYSISINKPCIVQGPIGSGKTALIDYLAAKSCRISPPDYVKIQICDQIDSKSLIGSYVTTEIPGQFEWQPGPLASALVEGSWIVFEDIDLAPPEISQILQSVIENGNLSCVSSCPIRSTRVHPDFRILFTKKSIADHSHPSLKFLENLCSIVKIPLLEDQDLAQVIDSKFRLGSITPLMLKIFSSIRGIMQDEYQVRCGRIINQRDLFKLCSRLARQNLCPSDGKLSSRNIDIIFLEMVECYLAFLPREYAMHIAKSISPIVNIPVNEVQRLMIHREIPVSVDARTVKFGRAHLDPLSPSRSVNTMAYTRQSLRIMEGIASCLKYNEPVLLVGETGVGKTSVIHHISDLIGARLTVMNLSQQSDSSDLLGGFRPVEMRLLIKPIHTRFEALFRETYDVDANQKFLDEVSNLYINSKRQPDWSIYLKVICKMCLRASTTKLSEDLLKNWNELYRKVKGLSNRMSSQDDCNSIALTFSDGPLLTAIKEGHWILLDEINLAEPDVLQCLLFVLDSLNKPYLSVQLTSPSKPIKIHPSFRIFACMNPSTDIGKRDLDSSVRSRFSEFFIDEITDKLDLRLIVESYVKASLTAAQIAKMVEFYTEIRARSDIYCDLGGNSPIYSLRTLCQTLSMCSANVCGTIDKSLYESIQVAFLQQLDDESRFQAIKLLEKTLFDRKTLSHLENNTPIVVPRDGHQYICIENFCIQISNECPTNDVKYVLTDTVHQNLKCLARIISMSRRRLPILIQGSTSVGKTSLIMHLAKSTGNRCYRINNHEHTDLQEYVGRYVLKENGDIVFHEGLLVRAMRKGYWIILDELNLAPSELLEALNRVLDDNRELFIPETKEVVKAHSRFVLFATQNPPGEYAGRKFLSRAFRNRFAELFFRDLPTNELEIILQERCEMANQYSKKIVSVMRQLQMYRRESGMFIGRHGFMTMRDLLRWGERYCEFKKSFPDQKFYDWDNHIAVEGLILLEGRVRSHKEADVVKKVIEDVFNRELDREEIYKQEITPTVKLSEKFHHIHYSLEFRKMLVRLSRALKYREPVVLCGPTGCGKTTVCQFLAEMQNQAITIFNCHMGTESSDFIGSVRPSRDQLRLGKQTFKWVDGPLISSMKEGSIFLMDEISLADDAVLERINSVLEQSRSITLTERNGEEITANEKFRVVATMNPGGDYGKKELSAALRNRFTEIYCHDTTDLEQLVKITAGSLSWKILSSAYSKKVLNIFELFMRAYFQPDDAISIRDIISFCKFLNKTTDGNQIRPLSLQEAIANGISLVFFDQIGTCGFKNSFDALRPNSLNEVKRSLSMLIEQKLGKVPIHLSPVNKKFKPPNSFVNFKKFYLEIGPEPIQKDFTNNFICNAPIVKKSLLKLARAMQLDRPILLEGDPGAGKTSIVSALAKLTGHKLVRINLSEQTDISDLFGSDLPDIDSTSNDSPHFKWCDGPLLQAIKNSKWILLDEMNLASQSVLEGLNSCLDHRGEIFIPELNKKFVVQRSKSRIFACQNPYRQGGARKGLPKSFLDRFTSIFIKAHSSDDLRQIICQLYPIIPVDTVAKMIEFNQHVNSRLKDSGIEYNLRTLIHWCELITRFLKGNESELFCRPDRFVQFSYLDGIRSTPARIEIMGMFTQIFGLPVYEPPYRELRVGEHFITICRSMLRRNLRLPPHLPDLCILKYQMPYLESIAKAVEFNKMPIIVGDTGVGKKSMIRVLAGLTGNSLNIMGANRDMDTTELLGSYEQKNLMREIIDLLQDSKSMIISIVNEMISSQSLNSWSPIFSNIWSGLYAPEIEGFGTCGTEASEAYRGCLTQLRALLSMIKPNIGRENELTFKLLSEKTDRLILTTGLDMKITGNFDWVDSLLVSSVKDGSWLLIENANLMNPATLDRLNSLVEPKGFLTLNEKGSVQHGIETIRPHRNFRLILTMDPENGELSRAMRNRGTEIFVQTGFYFEDFLMLLNQNGFEPEEKTACMAYCIMKTSCDIHELITGQQPQENGSLLTRFGLNYIPALAHQIRRGVDAHKALADLLVAFYSRRGFSNQCSQNDINQIVSQRMTEYEKTYAVNLLDERYKWMNFRHDLVLLTGGDPDVAMVERDSKIFFDDFSIEDILKPDEVIDNLDIVNTCLAVRLFLELSTRRDIDYRIGFLSQIFKEYPNLLKTISKHLNVLNDECLPSIISVAPHTSELPLLELPVDSRNCPSAHYYLQCLDYQDSLKRQEFQNRWMMSLQRIMLSMIVELVEERSSNEQHKGSSLWSQSERLVSGAIVRDHLVRPNAEIAHDLCDLLSGIMNIVNDRCFDNNMIAKMMPRMFWISYFICKLRRRCPRDELIAVSNQLPMLWALTYQKILLPIIKECELADLTYKSKKFSNRIQHICEFFGMTLQKPSREEKNYYKSVLNPYASTTKPCSCVSTEINKHFAGFISKYSNKQTSLSAPDNIDLIMTIEIVWSKTYLMKLARSIANDLLHLETLISQSNDYQIMTQDADTLFLKVKGSLKEFRDRLEQRDTLLIERESFKPICIQSNRKMSALDQFAPIWQFKLLRSKLFELVPSIGDPGEFQRNVNRLLDNSNGLLMSPQFYSSLIKFLDRLTKRKGYDDDSRPEKVQILKEDSNMYASYLTDLLQEGVIFDTQIVGWTKLRATVCNLPSIAPLIPEYSAILSFTAGLSLDISCLKLSSYLDSSAQLDSMLIYLWRSYVTNKLRWSEDSNDIYLVKNLVHLRIEQGGEPPIDDCKGSECAHIDSFIRKRVPTYDRLITDFSKHGKQISNSIKLVYYGYLNCHECAPIFTVDPSVRVREKLEIYNSELAHIKLDLNTRNTLYYWRTGENLQLNEIDTEDAVEYTFSTRLLIDRRCKLEKSVAKLRRDHYNRPRSDDGSLYYNLRKEVEIFVERSKVNIKSLIDEFTKYFEQSDLSKSSGTLNNLISRCRMMVKSQEKMIIHMRTEYNVYSDITTNFLAGVSIMQQGLRALYFELEKRMQTSNLGLELPPQQEVCEILSFGNLSCHNMELVLNKLRFFPRLEKVCSSEEVNRVQSVLLKTILAQLYFQITTRPSDIDRCFYIVRNVADLYHKTWVKRKAYIEEKRQESEKMYQYKTYRSTLGNEVSYEQQEFLELCSRFPTYEHFYKNFVSITTISSDEENLITEEKIVNLNRSADLSLCNDICRSYYRLMIEASHNLLGGPQKNAHEAYSSAIKQLRTALDDEAEVLFKITRHCAPALDREFDCLGLEYFMMQNFNMVQILQKEELKSTAPVHLKKSIEILDEEVFNVYHDGNPQEALRFQKFIQRLDSRINILRTSANNCDSHPMLVSTVKLLDRISSFLLTDPMMKFITGAHSLLQKIEEWNRMSIPKEEKLLDEAEEIIKLIKSWRQIELSSWRNALHSIKRNYIDSTLCDLWFRLYGAFSDPIKCSRDMVRERSGDDTFEITKDVEEYIYLGFALFVKNFLEDSTLGDHRLRLDLVYSFIIQTKFSSFSQSRSKEIDETDSLTIDYTRLTIYAYNTYMQYKSLLHSVDETLQKEEDDFNKMLNTEIRIVAWQGRNLWEVKNNFRISHRKLNSVMTKYLQVLRRPIPSLGLKRSEVNPTQISAQVSGSEALGITFSSVNYLIQDLTLDSNQKSHARLVTKFKDITTRVLTRLAAKYINNIVDMESAVSCNTDAISAYYNQDVKSVMIGPKDNKETKQEKLKLCRQMYHSKKFALQSVFKTLRNLGLSYQRGLSNLGSLDKQALSLEPTRGLILKRNRSDLEAASMLLSDSIITSCNEKYQRAIAQNMSLLHSTKHQDITSDQLGRIQGFSLDIILNIIQQTKFAAITYRYLFEVQAASNCLKHLCSITQREDIFIYDYSDVQRVLGTFSTLVGHAILTLDRIELFSEICSTASNLERDSLNCNEIEDHPERLALVGFMSRSENSSMLTIEQIELVKENSRSTKETILAINDQINDLLHSDRSSHLYGDKDVQTIEDLYSKFTSTLDQMGEALGVSFNSQSGTLVGSLLDLCSEAKGDLARLLNDLKEARLKTDCSLDEQTTNRMKIRFKRLVNRMKLTLQQADAFETEPSDSSSQPALRKPYSFVDVAEMDKIMRPKGLHKRVTNIFLTLNNRAGPSNIDHIAREISPLLYVSVQLLTAYLNIIFASINSKLDQANLVIPFFSDLVANGFGLPIKIEDLSDEANAQSKASDENAGFGEGQGDDDASKKIEAESQLDDLKDHGGANERAGEDKNIDAHDDGIEMTDDFGGDSQGPDDAKHQEEDEDGEENNEQEVAELDKEMGEVEGSDDHLDEKIWSDVDEDIGDDDERDLLDAQSSYEKDHAEMQAKDDTLSQAKNQDDAPDQDQPVEDASMMEDSSPPEPDGQKTDTIQETIEVASDEQPIEEPAETVDEGGPPSEDNPETEEAPPSENNPETEAGLNDVQSPNDTAENMDISDGEEGTQTSEDYRSVGECSQSDSENDAPNQRPSPTIDDEHIDQQLEAEIDFPISQEPLLDPIEQIICDRIQGQDSLNTGKQTSDQRIEGSYSVFEENPNDPLDDGLSDTDDPRDQDADSNTEKETEELGLGSKSDPNGQASEVDKTKKGENVDERHLKHDVERRPSKRTPVEPSSDDIRPKRQKIHEAANRKENEPSKKPEKGDSVRHTEKGQAENVDVIDLVSDDESVDKSCFNVGEVEEEDDKWTKPSMEVQKPTRIDISTIGIDEESLSKLWFSSLEQCKHLVYELCQQLQIVLQPTKMSRYKGDYKTGKRLNMRKIISYVASNYRKDKIWLRRTKPSKRTYNICLAVDNSSSMSENNCRQMTYESLALLAKSLSIIEAGSLNVISFGEKVKNIHDFEQPYDDSVGLKWLKELQFDEKRTSYLKLLHYASDAFAKRDQASQTRDQSKVSQLLIIISDGRNVSDEEGELKRYLRQLKTAKVVTFFIIIDDLKRNEGKSLSDVKRTIRQGANMVVFNYMELFPFPFYVLLHEIEAMPSVLGGALRQWFELASQE